MTGCSKQGTVHSDTLVQTFKAVRRGDRSLAHQLRKIDGFARRRRRLRWAVRALEAARLALRDLQHGYLRSYRQHGNQTAPSGAAAAMGSNGVMPSDRRAGQATGKIDQEADQTYR